MPTFFSLPPELRNMIYDILHQHEQELDSERLTFVMPLTHVRNVSRLFRDEYDKRSPRNSRLAISQGNWSWGQFTPARDAAVTSYTELEFNFDVYDEARKSREFAADFDVYSTWISNLLYGERHLPGVVCGGELHLRLFFSYLSTFNTLRRLIAKRSWFDLQCSKISLVLYSGNDGIPNEASLSRARILAVWTRGVGWQDEVETIRSLRAEIV